MKTCTCCGETKPLSDFYNRNARCKPCHKQTERARYYAKREHVLEVMRHPDARERQRERDRQRSSDPKRRQQMLDSSTRWRLANPDRKRDVCATWNAKPNAKKLNAARAAKRRAMQAQATPPWADQTAINFFYASMTYLRSEGLDVHVDHKVPLKCKTACGLHVHFNLQLMFATLNVRKSNRYLEI